MTKLAKLEEYKAPWEIDSTGAEVPEDEQQVDTVKLKKYLHGLLSDKERLQTTVATVTTDRDNIKQQLDAKVREGLDDEGKAEADRKKALDEAKAEGTLPALKLDVALDIEGITAKQAKTLAKSLSGQTREELEAHAKELVETFNILTPKPDENETEEEEEPTETVARRPRRVSAVGDTNPTATGLPAATAENVNEMFPRR